MQTIALTVGLAVGLSVSVVGAGDPLGSEALRDSIEALFETHPVVERTSVALKVVDLASGEVLFDRGGERLMTPASNLKIYTSAAMLDLMGAEHRYTTRVWGTMVGGVVDGPLVLQGDGDPMLSSDDLARIADRLVEEVGVAEVGGIAVVGEVAAWDALPDKGPGWMWDDEPDYYNMTITPLMVDFNVLEVVVRPGAVGGAAEASLALASPYPRIRNEAVTVAGNGTPTVTRRPFEDDVVVTGSIGADAQAVTSRITMDDPRAWVAGVFGEMLRARGVVVRDDPVADGASHHGRRELLAHEGKTVGEAVQHFLTVSENAAGEMFLLKLGEIYGDVDASGAREVSWGSGAKVISAWLVEEAGLAAGSFRLVDGSGLSRYNLISADSSIRLLSFMRGHAAYETFFDGLVSYRVRLPAKGTFDGVPFAEFESTRVFGKPGGMSGVSTVSGYLQTLDGEWLAFSFLANGYIGSAAGVRDLRNGVWGELVRYRRVGAGVGR